MENIYIKRTGNLMMPARQVFQFEKSGGNRAPSKEGAPEAQKAPPAAPTEKEAQKAREALTKKIASLEKTIQDLERNKTMNTERKNALLEQARKKLETIRPAAVLPDAQHKENNAAADGVVNAPKNHRTPDSLPLPGDPSIPPAGPERAPTVNDAQRKDDIEARAKEIAVGNPPNGLPGIFRLHPVRTVRPKESQAWINAKWAALTPEKQEAARKKAAKEYADSDASGGPPPQKPSALPPRF